MVIIMGMVVTVVAIMRTVVRSGTPLPAPRLPHHHDAEAERRWELHRRDYGGANDGPNKRDDRPVAKRPDRHIL